MKSLRELIKNKGEIAMETILKCDNIKRKFKNGEEVLKGISLKIKKEEFLSILGPSGSGKTTLLNVISGLLKPTSGKVWYLEKEVTAMSNTRLADWKRDEIGNIFQNYLLLSNLTVRENIEIGISSKREPISFDKLVKILDIENILDKFPSEISGGEQQRTAIARAVVKKPRIIFCDEATGALDEVNSKKVIDLLHSIKKEYNISVVFITHNLEIAKTANRVITIKNGLLFKEHINENPISAEKMNWGEGI